MKGKNELSSVWLKASVIGSLWASSEIILGSFLHNAHIPFSGTILTFIAVILLVGSSRYWKANGIIWRAGLICAVMKTISPSADIFGPMISIAAEAFILEAVISFIGSNYAGFILGGGLAVSWSLFYKIINLIIIYGFNIIELYSKLYQFAIKQLNIPMENPWTLIFLLFFLDLIIGGIAGLIGIRVSQMSKNFPDEKFLASPNLKSAINIIPNNIDQKYSIPMLLFHITAIAAGLILLGNFSLWISSIFILSYVVVCIILYKQNLKRLKKPKFWFAIIVIALLSGWLLSNLNNNTGNSALAGFYLGVSINLRAFLMIIGFSSISIEIRNPVIEKWFKKKGMSQFSQSLEAAFRILPFMVANISEEKKIFKQPVSSVARLIKKADDWLERIEKHSTGLPLVFIIKGEKGSGKTTLLTKTVECLRAEGLNIGGILAPGYWSENKRAAFDIVDVCSGNSKKLCSVESNSNNVKIGNFYFEQEGLKFGRQALALEKVKSLDVCVVDEIGPLELKGEGWSNSLDEIFSGFKNILVLVVRNELIEEVCRRWSIQNPVLVEYGNIEDRKIANEIIHYRALITDEVPVEI